MILDVQTILKTDGARVPVEGSLLPPKEEKEYSFLGDTTFSGTVTNVGGVLELSVLAEGRFTVPCARCLKPVEESFSVPVTETLAHEETQVRDRDAVVTFTGNSIDLGAVIWPNIFLALGSKYLCKEDCKGLCPMCGADLNETSCSCEEDNIDPRLAGLKDFFK